jgi:hypothetical protein
MFEKLIYEEIAGYGQPDGGGIERSSGIPVAEACRKHAISAAAYHQ